MATKTCFTVCLKRLMHYVKSDFIEHIQVNFYLAMLNRTTFHIIFLKIYFVKSFGVTIREFQIFPIAECMHMK